MTARPVRLESRVAWELRGAWATLREVVVVLDRGGRVRGYVEHVSPTDAFALVWDGHGPAHVPLALVVAVRRPHLHEDAMSDAVPPPPPRARVPLPMPGQLAFALDDPRVAP